MKVTECDRKKRVSVKLVETAAESESIPEGNEEARRRESLGEEGGEVRGRCDVETLPPEKPSFFSLSVPLDSRVGAAADRAPPCSPCGSLPWAYHHSSAGRHVLRDTHEKSDSRQKNKTKILLYIYIYKSII